jgi:hypothetical protein
MQGSVTFTLEKDLEMGKWITRDAPSWLDNDIVIEIGEQVDLKKSTPLPVA